MADGWGGKRAGSGRKKGSTFPDEKIYREAIAAGAPPEAIAAMVKAVVDRVLVSGDPRGLVAILDRLVPALVRSDVSQAVDSSGLIDELRAKLGLNKSQN